MSELPPLPGSILTDGWGSPQIQISEPLPIKVKWQNYPIYSHTIVEVEGSDYERFLIQYDHPVGIHGYEKLRSDKQVYRGGPSFDEWRRYRDTGSFFSYEHSTRVVLPGVWDA